MFSGASLNLSTQRSFKIKPEKFYCSTCVRYWNLFLHECWKEGVAGPNCCQNKSATVRVIATIYDQKLWSKRWIYQALVRMSPVDFRRSVPSTVQSWWPEQQLFLSFYATCHCTVEAGQQIVHTVDRCVIAQKQFGNVAVPGFKAVTVCVHLSSLRPIVNEIWSHHVTFASDLRNTLMVNGHCGLRSNRELENRRMSHRNNSPKCTLW